MTATIETGTGVTMEDTKAKVKAKVKTEESKETASERFYELLVDAAENEKDRDHKAYLEALWITWPTMPSAAIAQFNREAADKEGRGLLDKGVNWFARVGFNRTVESITDGSAIDKAVVAFIGAESKGKEGRMAQSREKSKAAGSLATYRACGAFLRSLKDDEDKIVESFRKAFTCRISDALATLNYRGALDGGALPYEAASALFGIGNKSAEKERLKGNVTQFKAE